MAERIYHFLAIIVLAFWMGGFTFYALVVIPTGNRVLGGSEQGLVTQQVSGWMNWIGVATLAILFIGAWRSRALFASWFVMAAAQIALFWLHPHLDGLIDSAERAVVDHGRFYQWHRAYLIAATIQWLAAVLQLWWMTAADQTPRGPQPYDMRRKNMAC
jgi:hypothetical protein